MSVLPVGFGSSGGIDTGDIPASLRFRGAQYLSRTPGSAGDRKTWTWSGWVKRSKLGAAQTLFNCANGAAANGHMGVYFNTTDTLLIASTTNNASNEALYETSAVFRDVSAHYHVIVAVNTTNATAADRVIIYVNGVRQAIAAGGVNPTQNLDLQINRAIPHFIGVLGYTGSVWYQDGYLSRICLIDGTALTPDSFGYLNTTINEWVSKSQSEVKAVVDAGGTNSFMLDFNDATSLTTLGNDFSSKNNDWTLNNFSITAGSSYDHMLDVPGNSYATLNPIDPAPGITFSEANLKGARNGFATACMATRGSQSLPTSGKWYWEVRPTYATAVLWGIANENYSLSLDATWSAAQSVNAWVQSAAGTKFGNGVAGAAYGVSIPSNSVAAVAWDADNQALYFTDAAGTWQNSGVPTSGASKTGAAFTSGFSGTLFPLISPWLGDSIIINFGQRPFAYTPPTGFKALCQANLETPAILNPEDHHVDIAVTKSGDTNFTLPWSADTYDTFFEIKRRDSTGDWYQIDGLRGYTKILKSNSTAAETTDANVLGISGTTGTLKSTLADGTYIISATKAGLAAARQTNTDGSITSTVSRNVDSGFAIVTYTGTGANATVGHGLGKAPSLGIIKNLSSTQAWTVGSMLPGGWDRYWTLNATDAQTLDGTVWNTTNPTSTTVAIGTSLRVNGNGGTYVAYCYADSAIQKSFSYTGNGSADGPYVNLGFKCGGLLLKRSDSTQDWLSLDTARDVYNVSKNVLAPNTSQPESVYASGYDLDILSNGFKFRNSVYNAGSGIGHAWAATTGKYSLAR